MPANLGSRFTITSRVVVTAIISFLEVVCAISPDKSFLEGAKHKKKKQKKNNVGIIITLSVSIPGNTVLVFLRGWKMGIGLCVHANSLYRSEGRGKLPQEKPQWSMCNSH